MFLPAAAAVLLLAVPLASAQTSAGLASRLDHLAAAADALHSSLPNFECTETVTSRRLRKDKETWRVNFTANLRVQRDKKGAPEENFTFTTLEGQPVSHPKVKMPTYVEGGFTSVLDTFARRRAGCYVFTLSDGRINFSGVPGRGSSDECGHVDGLVGFALLNPEGEVTHIERTVPADVARKYRIAPQAAIDLAPVELNGRTYRLSSHVVSTWPDGKDVDYFEATYSACHLFAAQVTLLPGSEVITGDTPDPAPK